jgi:hypothetical protein
LAEDACGSFCVGSGRDDVSDGGGTVGHGVVGEEAGGLGEELAGLVDLLAAHKFPHRR